MLEKESDHPVAALKEETVLLLSFFFLQFSLHPLCKSAQNLLSLSGSSDVVFSKQCCPRGIKMHVSVLIFAIK